MKTTTIKVVETKNGGLRFYTLDQGGKCVAIDKRAAFSAVCWEKARFVDSFKNDDAFITVFVNGTVAVDAVTDKVNFANRLPVQAVYCAKIVDGIARASGKFFDNGNGSPGGGYWGNDGDRIFPVTNCTPAAKAYAALSRKISASCIKASGEEPDCNDAFDDLIDWARGGYECADGGFELLQNR